jgi:hypothetical protein
MRMASLLSWPTARKRETLLSTYAFAAVAGASSSSAAARSKYT